MSIAGELVKCRFLDLDPQYLIHRSGMGPMFSFFNKWGQWRRDGTSRTTALELWGHSPFRNTFKMQALLAERLVLFKKCSLLLGTPSVYEPWLFNPHYQHVSLSFPLLGNFVSSTFLALLVSFQIFANTFSHFRLVLWMFCIARSLLYLYCKFYLFYN